MKLLLFASLLCAAPAFADDAQFRGDVAHTGVATTAGPAKLAAVKWKFHTGGPVVSSPVLADKRIYVGSSDHFLYALDVATGTLAWKFPTGDVVHASPAIADGKLYVGSWDSYFYALDAATGTLVWKVKTGEDPKIHNQQGFQASAVVSDGTVYVGCRDSNFYAFDAATGDRRWAFSNKGSWVVGSAAVAAGKVYFAGNQLYLGSNTGKLFAIDLASHKIVSTFATDAAAKLGATFTNADGTPNYHAAFTDNFYDDIVVGVTKMMSIGAIMSTPAVGGGLVYFGSADGNVYAVG